MFKELFTEAISFKDPDDEISYVDYGRHVDRYQKQAQDRMSKIAKMIGVRTKDLGSRELRNSSATQEYAILAQNPDGSRIEVTGDTTGSSNPVILSYVSPRGTKLASVWLKDVKKTKDLTKNRLIKGLNELKKEMEFRDVDFDWPRNFNKYFK
jgi:hypothetical protein